MPFLLDAYCGQGGASAGYVAAGFTVVGVDDRPQPRYPFAFTQADALEYIVAEGWRYDVIHASPPCHDHSSLRAVRGRNHSGYLLWETRTALQRVARPWVIENVPGADMPGAVTLCGSMFDLGAQCRGGWRELRRHRLFESSTPITPPATCRHEALAVGVYGHGGGGGNYETDRRNGYQATVAEAKEAMGIEWMTRAGMAQAIPPAYTDHVGRQLLAALGALAGHVPVGARGGPLS
jgi:DNA (cytosine-5)-methyltransferase 1